MSLNIPTKFLKNKYKLNLNTINALKSFKKKLKDVSNPEKKRKIIGNLFIKIFEKESKKFKNVKYLAQGTLYPDIIESRSFTGSKLQRLNLIIMLEDYQKDEFKINRTFKRLFKDEVRVLGNSLGLKKNKHKHPFPGPGLAIRIVGNITLEKIKILQEADHIYYNELIK